MINVSYAVLGLAMLVLGLFAETIKDRLYLSEPLAALAVGVVFGPAVLGLVDPTAWSDDPLFVLEQVARLSLAVSLVGVALRLPDTYIRSQWRSAAAVLFLVMPLMWLLAAGVIHLVLGWDPMPALLLGAVITPTDPVVASSIVTGKLAERNIPERIRHLLSLESGANDGLAYLLLAAPILVLTMPASGLLHELVVGTVLREILLAVAVGACLGWAVARLRRWSEQHRLGGRPALVGIGFAMALAVLGLLGAVGSDGILGVFAAGLAFNWLVRDEGEARIQHVQEVLTRFFELPVFMLVGALLPWREWRSLGWSALVLVLAILVLRRLPAVLALRPVIGPLHDLADALFFGWFGPLGVAAVVWAIVAVERTGRQEIWVVASLVMAASVLAHGVTAAPASNLLHRRHRLQSDHEDGAGE